MMSISLYKCTLREGSLKEDIEPIYPPKNSQGMQRVPVKGDFIRIEGILYEVVQVIHNFDVSEVQTYLRKK